MICGEGMVSNMNEAFICRHDAVKMKIFRNALLHKPIKYGTNFFTDVSWYRYIYIYIIATRG